MSTTGGMTTEPARFSSISYFQFAERERWYDHALNSKDKITQKQLVFVRVVQTFTENQSWYVLSRASLGTCVIKYTCNYTHFSYFYHGLYVVMKKIHFVFQLMNYIVFHTHTIKLHANIHTYMHTIYIHTYIHIDMCNTVYCIICEFY